MDQRAWDRDVAFKKSLALTRSAAERSIADYISAFCNRQRRHSTLDYVSPLEFELKLQMLKAAA